MLTIGIVEGMTSTAPTAATRGAGAPPAATQDGVAPPSRARRLVCWATAAGMLPYFALKISWLSGSTVGIADRTLAESSTLYALNMITLGMDLLALLTALALTYRWGLRLPVWLLGFPMWVATGFLGTITLATPLGFLATALGGTRLAPRTGELLHPWVYGMVYTAFTAQGLGLAIAFVLHLRARWPRLFTGRVRDLATGPSTVVQPVLAAALGAIAVGVAGLDLYWACGGTGGLPAEAVAGRTATGQTVVAVFGLFALTAAAGVAVLVRRRSRARLALPLAAAWLGSGSLFSWGLWDAVAQALQPFQHDPTNGRATPLQSLLVTFQTPTGALLALLGLLALLEGLAVHRSQSEDHPQPADGPREECADHEDRETSAAN